jgi:hypothetical protein
MESEMEVATTDAATKFGELTVLQAISKAELDQQITTARAYPRSLKKFINECMDMATLNEKIAAECIYALPRDGKTIEGPSARLGEIVASAWGNNRHGARVVDEGTEFITAQGVFHDLERNVMITMEVRRRITNRDGKRFKADMIGVTGNAACSIALRNAVFKGVPKAFWSDIYDAARKAAVGDIKTLANKRADALAYLQKMGATQVMVLAALGLQGVEDIGLDELATLRGMITAIKEGDTSVEQAFTPKETTAPTSKPKTAAPQAKGKPKNGTTAATPDAGITIDQATVLADTLNAEGVELTELLATFEIGELLQLPASKYEPAKKWIESASAG